MIIVLRSRGAPKHTHKASTIPIRHRCDREEEDPFDPSERPGITGKRWGVFRSQKVPVVCTFNRPYSYHK